MADGTSRELHSSDDDELDELLDSALEDFDKNTPSTTKQCVENESKPSVSSSVEARQDKGVQGYTGEVVQDDSAVEMEAQFAKAAEDFENAMKTMLGNEPEILAQLGQFSKAAANADPGNPSGVTDFEAHLARTMSHLEQNTKDLEDCPTGPFNEDFFKAMADMNLGEGGEGEMDFLPLMQGMMQNLLSKDVLYPALKDLQEKYPAWLEEKKSSLPEEELNRYKKQFSLVSNVCSEYENEKEDEPDDIKKKRFEKLLGLMQQMQECGQPPTELVGEMPPGFAGPISEMPDPPEIPDDLKNECKVT
ncbi:PREDICTED: peroxisomal biogenesis factor 19-like isoform X2 [Acropora digitifera]|uniref:peroxisomal biogenesis factor 19-like isoform X1 n=1 Tax=Acropora digitifera TaxID=70779 RepID=UPI00077A3F03|nr:PREDICTED: peroxisomal biogenesis factor 19-like isoform X1 [Acropora digitifera]XP_015767725.1 PREDICTED: peroxisomal biogenesis factor 19-like isoform X2 [Acropora digitifera]